MKMKKISKEALELIEELERTSTNYSWAINGESEREKEKTEFELLQARARIKRYIKRIENRAEI